MTRVHRFRRFTWARRATALGFLGLLWWGSRGGADVVRGSLAGSRVLDRVPFVDPLAALESALSTRAASDTLLVGAGVLLLLALALGPVFCGWLCPLGLLLDLAQGVRRRVLAPWPQLAARGASLPRALKLGVLGAALAFSLVSRTPVFAALSPVQAVGRALLFGAEAALWMLAGLVLVETVAPRVWCRSLCPLGGLYGLVGRRAPLRVRIDPETAGQIRCRRCEAACPMGIRVMQDYTLRGRASIDHPDCTRCGACTEVCPKSVLRLGLRDLPREASTPRDASAAPR